MVFEQLSHLQGINMDIGGGDFREVAQGGGCPYAGLIVDSDAGRARGSDAHDGSEELVSVAGPFVAAEAGRNCGTCVIIARGTKLGRFGHHVCLAIVWQRAATSTFEPSRLCGVASHDPAHSAVNAAAAIIVMQSALAIARARKLL